MSQVLLLLEKVPLISGIHNGDSGKSARSYCGKRRVSAIASGTAGKTQIG
jgi:hypothetical protein